ncbi:MAG: 2'-5' RNA ligase family protein [Actinomycetota bacterium]|nr:2'-5' RNA ligase family protein [Actinomycetota bacterium]
MPTIGVAVAIPEPYGDELRHARLRCGDPLATAIPTHVTLLPPTEVDLAATQAIDEHLLKVADETLTFGMLLRGTGTFRPVSPVVFVQVAVGLVECERLAAQVRSGPLAGGELAFPYHPHVTIAHDTPESALDLAFDELAGYEASFEVNGFSLYRHGNDGVWRPVRTYGFSASGRSPDQPAQGTARSTGGRSGA